MNRLVETAVCLVVAAGVEAACAGDGVYTVFVTETSVKGDFGNLNAADEICQGEADDPASVVPRGVYLAWLSDEDESPHTRFTKFSAPVVLPNGTPIANDFADLTDGSLLHPVDMAASGKSLGTLNFWTGTNADGNRAGSAHCRNWTAAEVYRGSYGNTKATNSHWSSYQVRRCGYSYRLLCFQQ